MLLTILTAAAMMPQGPGSSTALVVINEFSYDDSTGTDDKEFVELYNRSNAPVDLSGWTLQCIEGTTTAAVNFTVTIPPGIVINPGSYVVIGTALVPNLTPGITPPAANWLENTADADGLVLFDTTLTPIDSVLWGFAKWTATVPSYVEGTGLWGRTFGADVPANPSFVTAQRRVDGYDSNNNGADFVQMTWTPGTQNGSGNTTPTGTQFGFDEVAGTTYTTEFASSFTPPLSADPLLIANSTTTTIALPVSPQGGNVLVMHDRTGGGNMHHLRTAVGEDFLVECYVHVFGGNSAIGATEGEAWAIGVGTTDPYASPVDVSGTYYTGTTACSGVGNREPGATGIAFIALQTTAQTQIYLVDMNDGGPGYTILGGPITATPGVNDGWQRLRIRASGTSITANFGGTFGANDGTVFNATVPARIAGQPYFQFRECALVNGNIKPLVIDHLAVYGIVPGAITFAGAGSPVSAGIPTIGTSGGSPEIANAAFAVTGGNFLPFGIGGILIKIGGLLPLGVQLPGAQPGAELWVGLPEDIFGIAFADGTGAASYGLPLPADNVFAGIAFGAQWLVADPALAFPLQVGSSQGMQVTIGN